MSQKEIKVEPGVWYRKHKTRKHGAIFDRYWILKHTVDGKQIKEGLGYSSTGMTQTKAISHKQELIDNKRSNKLNAGKRGYTRLPESFREMQEIVVQEKWEEEVALQAEKNANEPFNDFFKRFVQDREDAGRPHEEIVHYRSRYAKWVKPVFGKKPPGKVVLFDLQRMVKNMKGKAADSTIIKVVGIVSLAFSHNKLHHNYTGKNPVIRKAVFEHNPHILKSDNQRERYLSLSEAQDLLAALPKQVADMAKLSLLGGFRAGELFKMKWADINFTTARINIRDTKSGASRTVVMGKEIIDLLQPMEGKNGELVFPNPKGGQYKEIPKSFRVAVDTMGLNDGIVDRRQRIVFHSLRHTCGSWLVDNGVDLFTVQKVLGHRSIKTTERYVHSSGRLDRAAAVLDDVMTGKIEKKREGVG